MIPTVKCRRRLSVAEAALWGAAVILLLVGMLAWSVLGRVTVHNEDGSTSRIAPISYVTN